MENNKLNDILKLFNNNTLAHAYLISTNNVDNCLNDLINVIKNFYDDESFKHLIDSRDFPNLLIIEPDGKFIKKDQIKELRYKFSMTSLFSDIKVYIIVNAEKMNKESCNSILKFLEEPTEGTYGFFITNDKYNIINTITSRCEQINCYYENYSINEMLGIDLEKFNSYLNEIYDYLYSIEENNENILLNKKLLLKFCDRSDIINLFKIISYIYLSALNSTQLTEFNKDDFSFIFSQDREKLLNKSMLINKLLGDLNYNVNLELLLDRFVLEMGVINHDGVWNNI